MQYEEPLSYFNANSKDAFEQRAKVSAINTGFHEHRPTCHKGSAGRTGCRMARPAGHPVKKTCAKTLVPPSKSVQSMKIATVNEYGDGDEINDWRCLKCTKGDSASYRAAYNLRCDVREPRLNDAIDDKVVISFEI
jgi:hypothetical protein